MFLGLAKVRIKDSSTKFWVRITRIREWNASSSEPTIRVHVCESKRAGIWVISATRRCGFQKSHCVLINEAWNFWVALFCLRYLRQRTCIWILEIRRLNDLAVDTQREFPSGCFSNASDRRNPFRNKLDCPFNSFFLAGITLSSCWQHALSKRLLTRQSPSLPPDLNCTPGKTRRLVPKENSPHLSSWQHRWVHSIFSSHGTVLKNSLIRQRPLGHFLLEICAPVWMPSHICNIPAGS